MVTVRLDSGRCKQASKTIFLYHLAKGMYTMVMTEAVFKYLFAARDLP
jgi:hypothetical protein